MTAVNAWQSTGSQIPFLIPDMPLAGDVLPFLQEMDSTRWYSNFGPLYQAFEQQLWQRFWAPLQIARQRTFACANGTVALEMALQHAGLSAGARVLVPSFTFPASALAIVRVGMRPVFADVDLQSWQLTPTLAKSMLKKHAIAAVMPVAALGKPLPAADWDAFAKETGIPVILDAAAALGLQTPPQHCYSCFSLHATKFLGVGEGGVVVLPESAQQDSLRLLSNFGFREGWVCVPGGNAKLSEYHAAVGLAQMQRVDTLVERRNRIQRDYAEAFARYELNLMHQCLENTAAMSSSGLLSGPFWAAAAVRIPAARMTRVLEKLSAAGVGYRRWYAPALHRHPYFQHLAQAGAARKRTTACEDVSVTDALENTVLGLPFHHFLQAGDIDYIVKVLRDAL